MVCILGAWIGNGIKDAAPWETILDKIKTKLARWMNTNTTLYGKRLIIWAIIGRHTQIPGQSTRNAHTYRKGYRKNDQRHNMEQRKGTENINRNPTVPN